MMLMSRNDDDEIYATNKDMTNSNIFRIELFSCTTKSTKKETKTPTITDRRWCRWCRWWFVHIWSVIGSTSCILTTSISISLYMQTHTHEIYDKKKYGEEKRELSSYVHTILAHTKFRRFQYIKYKRMRTYSSWYACACACACALLKIRLKNCVFFSLLLLLFRSIQCTPLIFDVWRVDIIWISLPIVEVNFSILSNRKKQNVREKREYRHVRANSNNNSNCTTLSAHCLKQF